MKADNYERHDESLPQQLLVRHRNEDTAKLHRDCMRLLKRDGRTMKWLVLRAMADYVRDRQITVGW